MKKISFVWICLIALLMGCGQKHQEKPKPKDTSIVRDSVTSILKQIVDDDKDLKVYTNNYDVKVINICGTEFAINKIESELVLMSSVLPDTKEMRNVVEYISKYLGTPAEEEGNYLWSDTFSKDGPKFRYSVRLRWTHSDEGGTSIIFDNTDFKALEELVKTKERNYGQ